MDNHGYFGVTPIWINRSPNRADRGDPLHEVLDGYGKSLQEEVGAGQVPTVPRALGGGVPDIHPDACRIQLRANAGSFSGRSGQAYGHETLAASAGIGCVMHLPFSVSVTRNQVGGGRLACSAVFREKCPEAGAVAGGDPPAPFRQQHGEDLPAAATNIAPLQHQC